MVAVVAKLQLPSSLNASEKHGLKQVLVLQVAKLPGYKIFLEIQVTHSQSPILRSLA